MQNKLTLRLEDNIIAQAKRYAALQGRSLSDLVASYFLLLPIQPIQASAEAIAKKNQSSLAPLAPLPRSKFHGLLASLSHLSDAELTNMRHQHLAQKYECSADESLD